MRHPSRPRDGPQGENLGGVRPFPIYVGERTNAKRESAAAAACDAAARGGLAAFERDHLRQEELKLLGIEMIRVTMPRLDREPDAVIGNLATLLERRRHELQAP